MSLSHSLVSRLLNFALYTEHPREDALLTEVGSCIYLPHHASSPEVAAARDSAVGKSPSSSSGLAKPAPFISS